MAPGPSLNTAHSGVFSVSVLLSGRELEEKGSLSPVKGGEVTLAWKGDGKRKITGGERCGNTLEKCCLILIPCLNLKKKKKKKKNRIEGDVFL